MLKIRRTDIQSGSTISFGATVMGGAVVEPDTTVMPMAMVLKEMRLPTGTYHGSPSELTIAEPPDEPRVSFKEEIVCND